MVVKAFKAIYDQLVSFLDCEVIRGSFSVREIFAHFALDETLNRI